MGVAAAVIASCNDLRSRVHARTHTHTHTHTHMGVAILQGSCELCMNVMLCKDFAS